MIPNDPDNLPFRNGGKLSLEVYDMGFDEHGFTADCEHSPDRLDLVDSEYRGDGAIFVFRCSCGKSVTEFFRHSETRVSD